MRPISSHCGEPHNSFCIHATCMELLLGWYLGFFCIRQSYGLKSVLYKTIVEWLLWTQEDFFVMPLVVICICALIILLRSVIMCCYGFCLTEFIPVANYYGFTAFLLALLWTIWCKSSWLLFLRLLRQFKVWRLQMPREKWSIQSRSVNDVWLQHCSTKSILSYGFVMLWIRHLWDILLINLLFHYLRTL